MTDLTDAEVLAMSKLVGRQVTTAELSQHWKCSGAGPEFIAGEILKRRIRGMELEPAYVDVIVRRWQEFAGGTALLESTGQTFAEVEAERGEV